MLHGIKCLYLIYHSNFIIYRNISGVEHTNMKRLTVPRVYEKKKKTDTIAMKPVVMWLIALHSCLVY